MAQPSSRSQPEPAAASPRDWFLPAIEANGAVGECLQAVLDELAGRSAFVQALQRALSGPAAGGTDAVTELSQRIRSLENTLRFRLGILRPERPHAWFRAPAATSTGPFASALLDEPVFSPYDARDADRVRRDLSTLWLRKADTPLPFQDGPSLWRTLLRHNAELDRIAALPAPFNGLTLERLPDELPASLESRSLRAFLMNVRGEIVATRERLTGCYRQLWDASERLWALQIEQEARQQRARGASSGVNQAAYSMREEFKKRRQQRPPPPAADRDALRFMGFEDYPSADALRQRYIAMAKKLHPDLQGGSDTAFKMLSSAYSLLSSRMEGVR